MLSGTVCPPEQSIVTARWRDIESAGAGSELSHAASVVISRMFERRQAELLVGHVAAVRVLEVRTARREPRTRRAIVAARAQVTSTARRVSRQRLRNPFTDRVPDLPPLHLENREHRIAIDDTVACLA